MAENAGIKGMLGGQSIDIASEEKEISLDLLTELQEKKTGAFIEAAVVTPYYLIKELSEKQAEEDETAGLLRKLAEHIGLSFQIRDDILDVTSDRAILGKSTGKDRGIQRLPSLRFWDLKGAKERLDEEIKVRKGYSWTGLREMGLIQKTTGL